MSHKLKFKDKHGVELRIGDVVRLAENNSLFVCTDGFTDDAKVEVKFLASNTGAFVVRKLTADAESGIRVRVGKQFAFIEMPNGKYIRVACNALERLVSCQLAKFS